MDSRETSRINSAEGRLRDTEDDSEPIRRFPRLLAPPAVRRFSLNRISSKLAVAILAGLLLILGGGYFGQRSLLWLHTQPLYALRFSEIELRPEPPPWFPGGHDAFLKRVSNEANHEVFSALDVDLSKLSLKFWNDPLIKKVIRIERLSPNRIATQLEYRKPVALAYLDKALKDRILIDEEGVIIASTDVDFASRPALETVGDPIPLIRVTGLSPPLSRQPGRPWVKAPADPTLSRGDEESYDPRAQEAGELSAQLRRKLALEKTVTKVLSYLVLHFHGEQGTDITLQCGREGAFLMIRWQIPESDQAINQFYKRLSFEEKWEMLQTWLANHSISENGPPQNLIFSSKGVIAALEP